MRDERPAAYRGERVPTAIKPTSIGIPPRQADLMAARAYTRRTPAVLDD